MADPNKQHFAFLQRAANLSSTGFEIFRQMEALANDAIDLDLLKTDGLNVADATDRLIGLQVEDVRIAVQGIASLGDLLNSNDGSLRKAFKRLTQFSAG